MMKKLLSLLLCAVFALMLALPADAAEQSPYISEAEAIIAYKGAESGAKSTDEWISSLSKTAGAGAEWYVIALSRLGYGGFDEYSQALAEHLSENKLYGTNAQRCALGFIAAGCGSSYIDYAAENTIGEQGIMSYIWGLMLLSCGVESTKFSPDGLAEKIVSLRLGDGGFAISGNSSNVDVTAMAITALAPYRENEAVSEAIESSLAFLSSAQTENGGYISYGAENCESAAQVIIALCSLGIDPQTDERFIKNGNTVLDSMRSFVTAEGGYSHVRGGAESEMATAQALHAFTSMHLLESGDALFSFEKPESTPEGFRDVELGKGPDKSADGQSMDIKNMVCIAIIAACAVGIAVVALLPKKKKKSF
jgi:hypothetical protein